jgi:nickel/cobalt transporter (NicO) family protein
VFAADLQHWLYSSASAEMRALAGGYGFATIASALVIAAAFGFVHAFMPGHGKVALVSYHLGRPARILGGMATSTILVLTHVGSAVLFVLAGFTVIRTTLGGAGRAPALELASAVLVIALGAWLLVRALRHQHARVRGSAGTLAFVTGLAPCPLTTFIMVYAVANGIVLAGLVVTGAMAFGMIVTIFLFVGGAIMLRERASRFFERTETARRRFGQALEIASAVLIIVFGFWLFATRAT